MGDEGEEAIQRRPGERLVDENEEGRIGGFK